MLYKTLQGIFFVIFKALYRTEVIGLEKVPEDERIVICANHKSNLDPILLSANFKRQIHWMAKKELSINFFMRWLVDTLGAFFVDRNSADIKAMKTAMRLLKEKEIVGMFPEGTRVKEFNLANAKSGVALIAHRTKSVVVPCYIDGDYKIFRKMRIIFRDPIDLKELPKQSSEEYEIISQNILSSIYDISEIGD